MTGPIVEVVRRRSPRPVELPSAPLPPTVTNALADLARALRDVPRDCIRDPAELFIWLRRMAGRVEGVGKMRVTVGTPQPRPAPRPAPVVRALSARDQAEAVFGNAPKVTTKPVERRTITSRKGRSVTVETRRARAAGQFEMFS